MKIYEIMQLAQKVAKKSPCKIKVSCILLDRNNRVVATGYNHWSTIGRKNGQFTIHAEADALNKVRKPSTNLTAFIYRNKGKIITPCPSCQEILKSYGITYIWHSAGVTDKNEVEVVHTHIHT